MQRILFNTVLLSTLLLTFRLYGQDADLVMAETGPYSLVERSDWRRYNNGKYIGLVHREVRASISPKAAPPQAGPATRTVSASGNFLYQGNFFVLEETLHDTRTVAQAVDTVVPVSFQLNKSGAILVESDKGFPRLRGFPSFPTQKVHEGSKWTAPASRIVDPLNSGQPVLIPFTAEYEYKGTGMYRDTPIHIIIARYSVRYQAASRSETSENFERLQGMHTVEISIRISDGLPLLMRDNLDETYFWADGSSVQFKGFTLTFGTSVPPLDRDTLIPSLETRFTVEAPPALPPPPPEVTPPTVQLVAEAPLALPVPVLAQEPPPPPPPPDFGGDIEVASVPEGIRLTIKDIRFAPDSAEFLPEEGPRLDMLAEALQRIPERTFLIEGHTAATGSPKSELTLSVERAQHMVAAMVLRGIREDRFIYKGWGGSKPVGDNNSTAGRSKNRRVEITILE
ncbi:MAG: OmpA family protein [Treponema sp.]|jgi:outer membrane protein OmpA-like peptidoglycan-associated protein|nr:OmpA family protein [Treponema sp.]